MKIGWFQFFCSIMVIWSHAGNAELFLGKLDRNHPLMVFEYQLIPAVARISIPCFLMISGYLFYRGFAMKDLPGKWKRRVKTLLIPYLIWNLLYYFGYLAASRISALEKIINRPGIRFSAADMVRAMLFYRSNPVFWFMYQLIILVALAPVLYLILKGIRRGILFLAVLLGGILFRVSLPLVNLDALLYYCAAAFLALHGRRFIEGRWTYRRALTGIVCLIWGIAISTPYYTRSFIPCIVVYHMLAVLGLWLLADEDWLKGWKPWMGDTFFIYAFHFIPVRFINKAAAGWLKGNAAAAGLLYLLMPVPAIGLCCVAAGFLRRFSPAVWKVLNGGRGDRQREEPAARRDYFL